MRTSPVLALAGPQWRHAAVGSEWQTGDGTVLVDRPAPTRVVWLE